MWEYIYHNSYETHSSVQESPQETTWELPKIKGLSTNPKEWGSLLLGHPPYGPPMYRNCHVDA